MSSGPCVFLSHVGGVLVSAVLAPWVDPRPALQALAAILPLDGPGSDTAGSLAFNTVSWMDIGPTLQVASTALSLALSSCS